MKRFCAKVGLTAVTLAVSILVCEGVIRRMDLKTSTVASGLSRVIKYDPLCGWRLKPDSNTILEHPSYSTPIKINRYGLRGEEFSYQKAQGRKRILILGDSFAWGCGVSIKDSVSRHLEEKIGGIEVINAGVPGYSTDQELLWLERKGLNLDPDLVILLLY